MGIQQTCAPRKIVVALLALQFTWTGTLSSDVAKAHPGHEGEHCLPDLSREQSILISSEKKSSDESTADESPKPAEESTEADRALEPIAKVSPQEPDLAEPELAEPLQFAQVPTRAEPLQQQPAGTKTAPLATTSETEVISFHGITPGISKRINVLRTWGDPRSDDTQAAELKYRFDNLPAVYVRFEKNLVESIVVELKQPTPSSTLTRKLNLRRVRPVEKTDDSGMAIAQVFPERGVELTYAVEERGLTFASDDASEVDASPRIGSIVIEPIQSKSFLLRAAASAENHYTNTIADLKSAIRLDSTLGSPQDQLSRIYLKTGKAVTAERHASEAVELEPQNAAFRLQWAKCLRHLARYNRAVEEVRQVLETPNMAVLARAQALNEMGLLAALGSQKVARRAMPLHNKAIEIADELAISSNPLVSRPAKQLLVEAHLAVAVEISIGAWQQKDETVPQWIERASALAEALIAEDESYLPLRLQVAVSSLAAAANLEEPINPLLWIDEAEQTVAEIKTGIYDPLAADQYEWQLGLTYFHGSQIEHRRSEPDSAIHLGELADQLLIELSKDRDEMPDTAYLMGRLYFQIGAVHAVHYDDHLSACEWYDVAVDKLLNPVPVTTVAGPQQHGDALVSMGVSYWNQGSRGRAIEVTKAGVELIESAVESGLLEEDTLLVSYNNLAAMYDAEGESEPAARYERLAKQASGAKMSQKRSPGRSTRR
ncbi:MAG: tetratricopeptide repeat protein [Bythopirellula sp.]